MLANKHLNLLIAMKMFKEFTPSDLNTLFQHHLYGIKTYPKGRLVHFAEQKCTTWDLIMSGALEIQQIDEKGNVLTIATFFTGNNLGGNLLFSNHPFYPMHVIAKVDTEILHIKKALVLTLCQSNKAFLEAYLACISDKTTILTDKLKSISMKTIRESITEFLRYEYHVQKTYKIRLNMTKKELAERMGIQRTSLSRELQKMKGEGMVTYNATSITIEDPGLINGNTR